MKTRLIMHDRIARLIAARGISIDHEAREELNRLLETITLEALIRTKMAGRKRIQTIDIRRCPTCDKDRDLGPLKL